MFPPELQYEIFQLLVAASLGALIGLEREMSGKDPSFRTFALISLGSCVFGMISVQQWNLPNGGNYDPTRIAAQVVVGIGFLGAGAIFRSERRVLGLTTAALMWVTAGMGLSVGMGRASLGVAITIVALATMFLLRWAHRPFHKFRRRSGLGERESSQD